MTGGHHVTPEECRSMREAREKGYWIWLIAAEHGLSETSVKYHIYGNCTHEPD